MHPEENRICVPRGSETETGQRRKKGVIEEVTGPTDWCSAISAIRQEAERENAIGPRLGPIEQVCQATDASIPLAERHRSINRQKLQMFRSLRPSERILADSSCGEVKKPNNVYH